MGGAGLLLFASVGRDRGKQGFLTLHCVFCRGRQALSLEHFIGVDAVVDHKSQDGQLSSQLTAVNTTVYSSNYSFHVK